MAKTTTQCDRILRHLKDFGSITSLEAISEYGILRLASRIADIKRRGVKITRDTVRGVNRYGEATHYAVYSLQREDGETA
jgi:hypothetical protein